MNGKYSVQIGSGGKESASSRPRRDCALHEDFYILAPELFVAAYRKIQEGAQLRSKDNQ